MKQKWISQIALGLFVAQLLLMLLSWLLSAAFPVGRFRSLLSSEGLRWFLGRYADMLALPLLVWLLLLSMAYGCLAHSRLLRHLSSLSARHTYRERRALYMVLAVLAAYMVGIGLLTAVPHAVLLSATGRWWPSPFSASLVPLLAFGILVCSAVYGVIAGSLSTAEDVCGAMLAGIADGSPLLLLYVLSMQLYMSVSFVFPFLI